MKTYRHSIFFFIFFLLNVVWGQTSNNLYFNRNARTFEVQHGSLIVKSLAFACLGLHEVADGIPCSASMTPYTSKSHLKAEGLISNGYNSFAKSRKLITSDVDQSYMNELFSNEKVLQLESVADVMFTSKIITSRFTPYSFKMFSVARNDANPDIEMFAVDEQDLTVQTGMSFGNFDFGLELKKTDWKFVRQRFKLLDLSTQQGIDAIRPKKQSTLFWQPSVNYNIPQWWNTRFVIQAVNLGYVSEKYDEFPHPEEIQFGFGFSPPISVGKLDILLDYKSLNYEESPEEKLHVGALYRYGVMNLGLGLDSNGGSFGVFYGLEQVNAGILFSTTQLPWKSEDYFAQTVYLQVGWQL